jgi:TPR repeat protein
MSSLALTSSFGSGREDLEMAQDLLKAMKERRARPVDGGGYLVDSEAAAGAPRFIKADDAINLSSGISQSNSRADFLENEFVLPTEMQRFIKPGGVLDAEDLIKKLGEDLFLLDIKMDPVSFIKPRIAILDTIKILWVFSRKAQEKSQVCLYKILNEGIGEKKVGMNIEGVKKLVELGMSQGKAWAFRVQGQMWSRKKDRTPEENENMIDCFRQAAHKGDQDARKEFEKASQFKRQRLPTFPTKINDKTINTYLKDLIPIYQKFQYGVPLFEAYQKLRDDKKFPNEKIECLKEAANLGHIKAQLYLGKLYENGLSIDKDVKKAAYWFEKAAEQGNIDAQCDIGALYSEGLGVNKDEAEAVKWWQKAAEQGHKEAQHNLALFYCFGLGGSRDDKKAAYWCQKAAEQGYIGSQYNLGVYYQEGLGVDTDLSRAAFWFQKVILSQESIYVAAAQANLGVLYCEGWEGQPSDREKAYYFFKQAAKKNVPQAFFNLGILIKEGYGLRSPNPRAAYHFFLRATEPGCPQAMIGAAQCLMDLQEEEDYQEKALFWIQKALSFKTDPFISKYHDIIHKILSNAASEKDVSEKDIKQEERSLEEMDQEMRQVKSISEVLSPTQEIEAESAIIEGSVFEGVIGKEPTSEVASVAAYEPLEDTMQKTREEASTALDDSDIQAFKEYDKRKGLITQDYKTLREKIKGLGKLQISIQEQATTDLVPENKMLVREIKENQGVQARIDLQALISLFRDSFFRRQVIIQSTKSGFIILAHNRETNQHVTISTHRMHSRNSKHMPKDFKEIDPGFVKDLRKVLELFDL